MVSPIILSVPVSVAVIILLVIPNIGNFSDFISFSRVLSTFFIFPKIVFFAGTFL